MAIVAAFLLRSESIFARLNGLFATAVRRQDVGICWCLSVDGGSFADYGCIFTAFHL
ncbi:hypothetical protein LZP73_02365 [Shewanella sp. AS16]|uniref:hypothetical protein n=1 Tax=Shewanella sp. AS16 TaxID=2907625 RepID=UPI001F32C442|nr:hypothetical protein [Shewanella sp. AS16]MCE9685054.1 hypothetical protein [Shewanella sp. AS16]